MKTRHLNQSLYKAEQQLLNEAGLPRRAGINTLYMLPDFIQAMV